MTNYRSQAITLPDSGALVLCRESISMDIIDQAVLYSALSYDAASKRQKNRAQRFVQAVLRSEVTGDLGFPWAGVESDDAVLQAAFAGWQAMSTDDLAAWEVSLNRVNKAPVDPNSVPATTSAGHSTTPLTNSSPPDTATMTTVSENSAA